MTALIVGLFATAIPVTVAALSSRASAKSSARVAPKTSADAPKRMNYLALTMSEAEALFNAADGQSAEYLWEQATILFDLWGELVVKLERANWFGAAEAREMHDSLWPQMSLGYFSEAQALDLYRQSLNQVVILNHYAAALKG